MRTRFLPYLLAFVLSWLPFFLTWYQQDARAQEERRRETVRWEEEAFRRVDQFRTSWSFASQLEEMGTRMSRTLDRAFRTMPEDRIAVTPDLVAKAFWDSFPTTHRPPDSRLFAIAFDERGGMKPLSGNGFTREKSRVINDLLKLFARPPTVNDDDRRALNRRCAGLFGGSASSLYTFDTFASRFRGRPLPVYVEGGRSWLLWERIEWNNRLIGAWLTLIPLEAMRSARAIPRALQRLSAACRDGMVPVLVPLAGTPNRRPIVVPGGKQLSSELLAEIRAFRRVTTFPPPFAAGREHRCGRSRFLREFVSLHLPWELWIVSPAPAPARLPPFLLLWGSVLACFWGAFGLRVSIAGGPSSLPLARWFLGFFLLVGALPLTTLVINDLELIDSLSVSARTELQRSASRALDRLDANSTTVFQVFTARGQQIFGTPRWRRDIMTGTERSLERAWTLAHAAFRHHRLNLEAMLVYPATGTPRAFPTRPLPGGSINPRENLRFFQGFSDSLFGILGQVHDDRNGVSGPPASASDRPVGRPTPAAPGQEVLTGPRSAPTQIGESSQIAYNVFAGEDIGEKALQMRRRGDLIESDGEQVLHFHDLVFEQGRPQAHVYFRCRARPAFAEALVEAAHRSNIPSISAAQEAFPDNTRFVLARVGAGKCEMMVPKPETRSFWESREGRQMRRLLDIAGRTGSLQQRHTPDHILLATPCRITPGFLVGIVVPLQELAQASAARYGELLLTIILLGLPIILAALAVARSLVTPLGEMESVLTRVGAGDLRKRLEIERNDELGDLARSFNRMIEGLETRRKLGLFVSGSVEATLSKSAATIPEPPRERFGVVLASDLRSFTTISESQPPRLVTAMLNRHLETMSEVIRLHGGHVDSFIGDAVIALFTDEETTTAGAGPGPREPALIRSLRAAWAMTDAHRKLNAQRQARRQFTYEMGVGLDAGQILTGTLVAPGRLQHVLMGEPRERAEAMESASRHVTGRRIVVSRRMAELVEPLLPEVQLLPLEKSQEGLELLFLPASEDRP